MIFGCVSHTMYQNPKTFGLPISSQNFKSLISTVSDFWTGVLSANGHDFWLIVKAKINADIIVCFDSNSTVIPGVRLSSTIGCLDQCFMCNYTATKNKEMCIKHDNA